MRSTASLRWIRVAEGLCLVQCSAVTCRAGSRKGQLVVLFLVSLMIWHHIYGGGVTW
jgi:hypothetical protein